MSRKICWVWVSLIALSVFALGCMDRKPAPVCPVPTELQSTQPVFGGFEGVDIVVMVDDSGSMREEQEILSTAFFPLINSLLNPLPTWTLESTDDIRIAIVTSDMGMQWGGNPFNPAADGWPGVVPVAPSKCEDPLGRNGAFVTDYTSASVDINEGVIKCGAFGAGDPTDRQCPTGWTCENIGADDVGRCMDPDGDGTAQSCPPSPAAVSENYLTLESPAWNRETLAFATACMANVGTDGCGFEQQLLAPAVGLATDGVRTGFMREKALQVILHVTDEEDCSMRDGPAIFGSPEVQANSLRDVNIACGRNSDALYTPRDIKQMYEDAKAQVSGANKARSAVLFAAIIGVPHEGEGAAKCQGKGSEITECLDFPTPAGGTMGDPAVVQRMSSAGVMASYYEYVCERSEGGEAVTEANAGTRFIQLAQEYGAMSYIYSICNEDWSPAMEEIAVLVAQNIGGTCYDKRLGYDPATQTARCNAVLRFNGDTCPAAPAGAEWDTFEVVSIDPPIIDCHLPKIPMSISCGAMTDAERQRIDAEEFGWYYCENEGENFSDACSDGVDNDGDGLIDCEDPGCAHCANCTPNGVGDKARCPLRCRYMLSFTDLAQDFSGGARETNIQCLQEFRFEDPNCQENTYAACNDGVDNDGNGPFDCNGITYDQWVADGRDPDELPHNADPNCCPIEGTPGGPCNFDLNGDGREDWQRNCCPGGDCGNRYQSHRPDACYEAAAILQCTP